MNETLEKRVAERTQQLIHSERLSAVGQLAAGIVHEVRNPLTLAVGWIDVIRQDQSLGAEHQQALQIASEAIYRGVKILENLRDFSTLFSHDLAKSRLNMA